jgi:hypothetical protein
LVVFQIPPPTLPANIVDGLVLLIAMARMRPPTLPGPSQRHLSGAIGAGPIVAAGAAAENMSVDTCGAAADSTPFSTDAVRKRSMCASARP